MKFCTAYLRIIDCWGCFKSVFVPYTHFITSFQEISRNNDLSFICTKKNYFILRILCIYIGSINVPKLSVLAIFTGTNCGAPSSHAFTEHETDAICPPPTGIQCGGLFISSIGLSGGSSIYGRRVCWHSKGTDVFERQLACSLWSTGVVLCWTL